MSMESPHKAMKPNMFAIQILFFLDYRKIQLKQVVSGLHGFKLIQAGLYGKSGGLKAGGHDFNLLDHFRPAKKHPSGSKSSLVILSYGFVKMSCTKSLKNLMCYRIYIKSLTPILTQ